MSRSANEEAPDGRAPRLRHYFLPNDLDSWLAPHPSVDRANQYLLRDTYFARRIRLARAEAAPTRKIVHKYVYKNHPSSARDHRFPRITITGVVSASVNGPSRHYFECLKLMQTRFRAPNRDKTIERSGCAVIYFRCRCQDIRADSARL